MITILVVFGLSTVLAFLLTPVVGAVARRLQIVDRPGGRRLHDAVTPRAGGVAIYLAFTLPFVAAIVMRALRLGALPHDVRAAALLLGGALTFGLGLWDDARTVRPLPKLAGHVAAALIAYAGGIEILKVSVPPFGALELGWLSLPATVLWFVLVINALNLIDGLDGLAAGITLFATLILLIVLDSGARLLAAIGLAALAGACVGFLWHNFHPASIFLGDSGSYFLGYSLAAFSILGSVKSEATVAILIPIIALGVPVMDALWAPVRRFMLGQRLFHPDGDHIHHRLLKLGYTHRRAVLTLYAITLLMGLAALSLVHARNDRAALILVLVGAGAFVGIRKLGYLAFIHKRRLVGWLSTVSDELGLRRSRRSFLECQVGISQARNLADLWEAIRVAAQFLGLDYCALTVSGRNGDPPAELRHSRAEAPDGAAWDPNRVLRVSIPLIQGEDDMGSFLVVQPMRNGSLEPYLLRRVDQLGGTIIETLGRLRREPAFHGGPGSSGESGAAARVLFLSHYFPPEGNAPATRVHALCRHWVEAGHRVTVVTCAPNVPSGVVYAGYENRLYQREHIDGIDVVRVWTYLAANQGTLRRIVNYLSYMVSASCAALRLGSWDLVVATSPQPFCGWAGVIVSRLQRVPLVLEIRDIWPASIATVGALGNRVLLRALEVLERRLYAAAHHIVTVGDGYREELRKRGVPAEQVSVIPNGIDRDSFTACVPDRNLRHRWQLDGKFVCAYVGTVGMASGLEVVLDAARELKQRGSDDIAFLIVGDGAVRDLLERSAQAAGLNNVVFVGRQEKRDIPKILATVDACLVHLKRRELFTTVMPSKIFEAAAMSKPIVLGVQGHAASLVEEAGCGICIEPENAPALAAAVHTLARDPALGTVLGQRGRDFFMARFDRAALARQYLDVLRTVQQQQRDRRLGGRGHAPLAEPHGRGAQAPAQARRLRPS
jgi:UDP-N-acetylmuramyl pentapeptide phosphotransferase/UDP-N-acetylglucosamine-1-phosphate transferase/glycosyltransferase involved in cell wall biosynthesis